MKMLDGTYRPKVAPFAGAWIETARHGENPLNLASPPSRGRGLKPHCCHCTSPITPVAPFAGAWIETLYLNSAWSCFESPPSRGRGLKLSKGLTLPSRAASPPSRGRGLKHRNRPTSLDCL